MVGRDIEVIVCERAYGSLGYAAGVGYRWA